MGIHIATFREPSGACLYDSVTDTVFGPLLHEDYAEAFLCYVLQRSADDLTTFNTERLGVLHHEFLTLVEEGDEKVALHTQRIGRISSREVIGVRRELTAEQLAEGEFDPEDDTGFAPILTDGTVSSRVEVVESWQLDDIDPVL